MGYVMIMMHKTRLMINKHDTLQYRAMGAQTLTWTVCIFKCIALSFLGVVLSTQQQQSQCIVPKHWYSTTMKAPLARGSAIPTLVTYVWERKLKLGIGVHILRRIPCKRHVGGQKHQIQVEVYYFIPCTQNAPNPPHEQV